MLNVRKVSGIGVSLFMLVEVVVDVSAEVKPIAASPAALKSPGMLAQCSRRYLLKASRGIANKNRIEEGYQLEY
jgi:hypothetical protein